MISFSGVRAFAEPDDLGIRRRLRFQGVGQRATGVCCVYITACRGGFIIVCWVYKRGGWIRVRNRDIP